MKVPPCSSADVKVDHDSTQELASSTQHEQAGRDRDSQTPRRWCSMFESDKTILAVYKSLDDENSGARGNEMQTAGSRKHSLRQQQEADG